MKIISWLKNNKILLAIVILGAILRLYKLDYQSLWIDEIFSMKVADPKNDFGFIYDFLKNHDPHPPLYYFSIHTFFLLFGYSTYVLKLFSAIIGILGIVSIYFLGKEFSSKKVGLIAAFLTSINYFAIYYSQEGRMYSLLFFSSCIALFTLSKFIKQPSYKTMLFFVLGSLLLIYSQFFGVFELVSLYLAILFFIIKDRNIKLLKYSFLSGLLTIVLYIPSIIIVLSNPKRDSIWIQSPTFQTFELMFKEFFGFKSMLNNLIFLLIGISILSYVYKIIKKEKDQKITLSTSFVIILLGIIVTIILSLLYSYYSLPIVVSRYFISILPLILLLFSMLLYKVNYKYFQYLFLLLFCFFSIENLIYEKKFYERFYKTQFRDGIEYMVHKRPDNPIVCKLGEFYLRLYLNEFNYSQSVNEFDINSYISNLKLTKASLTDFWYFDAHLPNYQLTTETQEFLDTYFIIDDKVDLFDATIRHFKLKDNNQLISKSINDINSFSIHSFPNALFDDKGRIALYEKSTIKSEILLLKKGVYQIEIVGQSFPSPPINNENAHITIAINDNKVSDFYFTDVENNDKKRIVFKQENEEKVQMVITFENDYFMDNKDRNAFVKDIKFISK
jgi:uncharacterized membrane protein